MRTGHSCNIRVFAVVAVAALLIGAAAYAIFVDTGGRATAQIAVTRVWLDAVDAPGSAVYYLLDVNASYLGAATWHLDPSRFTLTSNASLDYAPTASYNATTLLGLSDIRPGESAAGEVVFAVPADQRPSRLSYVDPSEDIDAAVQDIPAVSAVASKFDPYLHYSLNGTSDWGVAISTWGVIGNLTTPNYVFFTGQKILASFSFYYHRRPIDPMTVVIESVTNDNGFPVSSVLATPMELGSVVTGNEYPLPISLTGYGDVVVLNLVLTVPPGEQHGPLSFTIQFSG